MKPFNVNAYRNYCMEDNDDNGWYENDFVEDGHTRTRLMRFCKKGMRRARRREDRLYSQKSLDDYNDDD